MSDPSPSSKMPEPKPVPTPKPNPLAMVIGTGMVVLHTRRYRRNLLFAVTLAMLLMVGVGSVVLGESLVRKPIAFAGFWGSCSALLLLVLCLAMYDLLRVRREHRKELRRLDDRLSEAMREARVKAAAERKFRGSNFSDNEPMPSTEEMRRWKADHEAAMNADGNSDVPDGEEGGSK